MVEAISGSARLVRIQVMAVLSPSYRRVRTRLAMIEAHHAPASPIAWA